MWYIIRCSAKSDKDTASQIVEIIWPLSAMSLRSDSATGCKGVLPLRTFIQETLRRSRTSYSTLQVALYYLIKIKPHVPNPDLTKEQSREKPVCRAMQCGRRMFLAALILASKYLQDRNYSARAWSKISGLNTLEINQNELMFLEAVGWRLHISEATFQRWTDIVLKYTPGAGGLAFADGSNCWRAVIPRLTPELDTVVDPLEPATPSPPAMARNLDSGPMAESPSPRNGSTAQEPTSLPSIHEQIPALRRNMLMTLEPTRMEYPNHPSLPSMPRPPMLPTPQMTPQSSSTSTPAASANNAFSGSRRPSISAAVSQAQNMGMARSTLDQRPPNMPFGPTTRTGSGSFDGFLSAVRRSSLARSSSSTSSPESMVSDVPTLSSSRSSRSSSVSSSTSGPCAPSSRLAVKATLRCTNNSMRENRKHLPIASPIDEGSALEGVYSSPEGYAGPVGQVPDFSHFSLGTPVDMAKSTQEAAQSLCELSGAVPARPEQPSSAGAEPRRCRKRGRTGSDDQLLQNQVRHLINLNASGDGAVLSDGNSARSFVIPESSHSQMQSASQLNLPKVDASLSGPAGMKRACCGHVARKIALNPTMRAEYLG